MDEEASDGREDAFRLKVSAYFAFHLSACTKMMKRFPDLEVLVDSGSALASEVCLYSIAFHVGCFFSFPPELDRKMSPGKLLRPLRCLVFGSAVEGIFCAKSCLFGIAQKPESLGEDT